MRPQRIERFCRLDDAANVKMDEVDKLLELYKQTQTPSERSLLLETVRISSPDGFSHLEQRILREQVRGMTLEELVQLIAVHRDLSLQQAEELLRDTILQNLLDRSKLNPLVPALGYCPDGPPGAGKSPIVSTQAAPQPAEAGKNDRGGVRVVILKDPKQEEKAPGAIGEVAQTNQNDTVSVPPKPTTPLPQLTPRGIGG